MENKQIYAKQMAATLILLTVVSGVACIGKKTDRSVPAGGVRVCAAGMSGSVLQRTADMKAAESPELALHSFGPVEQARVQMALIRDNMWDKDAKIRVRFLSGSPELQRRIKDAAMEWMRYEKVQLEFGTDPNAEVRVRINNDGTSWSLLGKECLRAKADQPTMNFGWLNVDDSQADLDSVVLHEFGHTLGCVHEHSSPGGQVHWNEAVVLDYCLRYWGWSEIEVRENIFFRYDPANAKYTRLDQKSIMMYSFPKSWTTDGVSMPWNYELSEGDKAFIARMYPKD